MFPKDSHSILLDPIRPKYSKTLNNRTRGANNEYRGVPAGPGSGFGGPRDDLCSNVRRGKPLRRLSLRKSPLGPPKPLSGPAGTPRYLLLAPLVRV